MSALSMCLTMKLKLSLRRFRRHVRAACPWLPPPAAGIAPTPGIGLPIASTAPSSVRMRQSARDQPSLSEVPPCASRLRSNLSKSSRPGWQMYCGNKSLTSTVLDAIAQIRSPRYVTTLRSSTDCQAISYTACGSTPQASYNTRARASHSAQRKTREPDNTFPPIPHTAGTVSLCHTVRSAYLCIHTYTQEIWGRPHHSHDRHGTLP
jgi:hypothetical protein